MSEPQLIVDPLSISRRGSGPDTGDIVLAIGGIHFPMAGWNDFVIVILDAWLSALLRVVQRTSNIERVHFMEGPYAVDLACMNTGRIQVRAIELPNQERAVGESAPLSLVANAAQIANSALAMYRGRDRRSAEIDHLNATLAELLRMTS
jgi:hypothetical protein